MSRKASCFHGAEELESRLLLAASFTPVVALDVNQPTISGLVAYTVTLHGNNGTKLTAWDGQVQGSVYQGWKDMGRFGFSSDPWLSDYSGDDPYINDTYWEFRNNGDILTAISATETKEGSTSSQYGQGTLGRAAFGIAGANQSSDTLLVRICMPSDSVVTLVGTAADSNGQAQELSIVIGPTPEPTPLPPPTPAEPSSATLVNPANFGTIGRVAINARGYMDVTFSSSAGLDESTILDDGEEFTLSGAGAGNVVFAGAATLMSGMTYRYSFTGEFTGGQVDVTFLAGSWTDGDGNAGVSTMEGFTVNAATEALVSYTIKLTNLSGEELSKDSDGHYQLRPGESFRAAVYVDDLRDAGDSGGILAAYANLTSSSTIFDWSAGTLTYGPSFTLGQTGTIDADSCAILVGGGTGGETPAGADPAQLLFTVDGTMRSNAAGSAVLSLSSAGEGYDTQLYGDDQLVEGNLQYGQITLDTAGVWRNLDAKGKLQYVDANGYAVTVQASRGVTGKIYFANDGGCNADKILLYGTNDHSTLTITTSGRNSWTSVGDIDADGTLATLTARTTTLTGLLEVGAAASSRAALNVTLGHVVYGKIISDTAIRTLSVTDWTDADTDADIVAGSISALNVRGDCQADLLVNVLSAASVGGNLSGARWNVQQRFGSLNVTGTAENCTIRSGGDIQNLTLGASDGSDFGAGVSMETLLNDRHVAVNDAVNAPTGTIRSMNVKGIRNSSSPTKRYFIDSNISAGVNSLKLTNWDGTGGLFARAGTVKSVRHTDAFYKDRQHNWSYPIKPASPASDAASFVNII
jgi:hypothetical protein